MKRLVLQPSSLASWDSLGTVDDTNGSGPFNDFAPDDISVVGRTAAVPGPLAGAGLIPLLGLAGAMVARRRRKKLAA